MAVLTRSALEESPLADLHAIASELGLDGFRRLRKADLIDAIVARQGGDAGDDAEEGVTDEGAGADATPADDERPARRRSRGGRGRRTARDADEDAGSADDAADEPERAPRADRERRAERESRGPREDRAPRGRGGRGREDRDADGEREDRTAEGTVELMGNGSGFLRVSPPDASDEDVYISAAQVRRCELVAGDTISGPVRPARRSERHPSLVRIDTINGKPADEVAEGTHFEDLPATYATERFELGSEDPTLKAIEWLTPIGKGSRVAIVGPSQSGKTEALRKLAEALSAIEGLEVAVALVGARPEELSGWPVEPVATTTFAASADAQAQALERAIDTAKRLAARGGDAVVLVDSLDGAHPPAARKAMGAARNIVDGGSLTVIATSSKPLGGETTVVALDPALTRTGRFPALDLMASGTLHPELLVGEAGADAIAQARLAGQSS